MCWFHQPCYNKCTSKLFQEVKITGTNVDKHYKFMTETPVGRLVIKLGIPTTISMLVTNIYNMADTYFVGTLGTSASGAVGIVFGLMAIIQAVGFMFGHGAGSIISRRLGAKDSETANLGFCIFLQRYYFWCGYLGCRYCVFRFFSASFGKHRNYFTFCKGLCCLDIDGSTSYDGKLCS